MQGCFPSLAARVVYVPIKLLTNTLLLSALVLILHLLSIYINNDLFHNSILVWPHSNHSNQSTTMGCIQSKGEWSRSRKEDSFEAQAEMETDDQYDDAIAKINGMDESELDRSRSRIIRQLGGFRKLLISALSHPMFEVRTVNASGIRSQNSVR